MVNKNAGDWRRGRTRYQPLVDHLAACDVREIILTYAEIEEIIGKPLSNAALTDNTIWTASRFGYVRKWRTLGWRARPDRRNQCVLFTRDTEERIPKRYSLDEKPSRYQPLFDFLSACEGDEVTLTYREIAAMIGSPLPATALHHTGWWTSKKNAQVRGWQVLGWRTHVSPAHLRVRFTRDVEREI